MWAKIKILLVFFILMISAASLYAENTKSTMQPEKLSQNVSLNLRNASIRTVATVLAKESDFNIVLPDNIQGNITMMLEDVTLYQALQALSRSADLTYSIENDIIYINKKNQPAGISDMENFFYYPKYISLGKLASVLKNYLGPQGKIVVDDFSGVVIISDTKKNLDFIKTVISKIDRNIKQVLIKAKIVELTKSGSQDLGIQWGATINKTTGSDFPHTIQIGGGATGGDITGLTPSGSSGYFVNMPVASPAGALNMMLGNYAGSFLLDIRLQALEEAGKAKVVSEPRIMTINNQQARIESGQEYKYKVIEENDGDVDTDVEEDEAKLVLEVKPQITPDNKILMNISVEKSELDFSRAVDGYPMKFTRKANSLIMVDDGETAVIGGLTQQTTSQSSTSVPFLSEIPFLGALFKSKSTSNKTNELVIFLTPKIVENNESVAENQ
ncbi:secretin N-terminal domain-containing protein [Flexistipes sp.]|uniref:secretin N-terminal domain-containing protein n=1 Tax=Flexistipes sp. TaxID=3088135 RepID=UPI002E237C19|nr:secretin N-terminal domain-containing protein [Flexistipes sp.]